VLNSGSTYTEDFPAIPGSVPAARAALVGFALAAGAKGEQLEDIRLAASEAMTNAVLHAYDHGGGSFHISASYVPDELWLLISDDGAGLRPGRVRGGLGLGLVLIAQLADDFEIVCRSNGGTQLQMRFRLRMPEKAPHARPRQVTGTALSRP
jgi:stage II sporulation protein AB (anti-sigma F factor)